jgi:outer membrane protein assembly factor BamB
MAFQKKFGWPVGFTCALLVAARGQDHVISTNLWTAGIGYYTESSPAVAANGVIYVSGWDGKLTAFDPDGRTRWTFTTRMEMCSSPAITEDGTILVGCRDRNLYCVSAAGQRKWRFKTGGWVDASPALGVDGTIYFGSWDGKFYALTTGGQKRWEFATGGPVLSSAALDLAGTIYFGAHDGRLYALNRDGSKRWEFPTRGRIISSPAIAANGDILFTSLDGKLYTVNHEGKLRWSLQTGGITASSPVLAEDGTIFLGINQAHSAVSADGKLKWQRAMSPNGYAPWDWVRSTPAAIRNGNVVVAAPDLSMLVFKPDGDWMIWNQSMEGASYSSPAIGLDGTIYGATAGGKLFAMKNTLPLAKSSWPMFRADPQHTGRARAVP